MKGEGGQKCRREADGKDRMVDRRAECVEGKATMKCYGGVMVQWWVGECQTYKSNVMVEGSLASVR